MMPQDKERRLSCMRIGLYFSDGKCTITKSPQKNVKIGLRTKLGWWITLVGAWIIFGHPNDFRTIIDPLFPEPPEEVADAET